MKNFEREKDRDYGTIYITPACREHPFNHHAGNQYGSSIYDCLQDIGKRKPLTAWISYHILKILLVNITLAMLLEDLIIQNRWLQIGYMALAAISNILSYVMFWYTFEGSFIKVFLVSMAVETSTVVTSSGILAIVNALERGMTFCCSWDLFSGWICCIRYSIFFSFLPC